MANNNNGILSGIASGLTSTYSYLASQYPNGLTLENLTEARGKTANLNTLNQSFASYLQTNFANIDKNGDGIITEDEMNNLSNLISTQGLTKAELTQLYASGASGISDSLMTKILENFDEMDTNHDGRVTSAEIASFTHSCNKQEKIDEENYRKATNMSVFYGDDNASTDVSSYSILSYKYKNFNS